MEFHDVANIFPMMADDEYQALVEDMRQHGLREPMWTHEGKIIDGRNRYRACVELGITPRFRAWDRQGSLVDFVASLNLQRRHLNSSQKAAIAVEVERKLAEETRRGRPTETEKVEAIPPVGKARDRAAAIMGTNPRYVSDAKRLAAEAPGLYQQVYDGHLSIPQANSQLNKTQRLQQLQEQPWPDGRYFIIYADPPWEYDAQSTDPTRVIENQYPTKPLAEICALPVDDLAAPDAVLYLWATAPKLAEAIEVVRAWGFTYRTSAVWVKDQIGMGYWFRTQHELLLVATKGNPPTPLPADRRSSVFEAPRGRHSEKPGTVYEMLEQQWPGLPKIELFARMRRDAWASWGNEVQN